jgi:predicted patatin/cPLA2 family phospholipase
MDNNTGLVLEGGGMRGAYTAGVLDYFLEFKIEFPNIYGVSAGALNGASYKSKQQGRSITYFTKFLDGDDYASPKYMLRDGNYFNIDFVYGKVPNEILPVDYETFRNNSAKLFVVVANIKTGEAEYFQVTDLEKQMDYVRASASLPIYSTPVIIDGKMYLDGGICDSIPLKQSQKDGNTKNVVILTQDRSFIRKPSESLKISKALYKNYPNFYRAQARRHIMYNAQRRYVFENEQLGNIFVIAPKEHVDIDRLEKNRSKLWYWYEIGYIDAKNCADEMMEYLSK